MHCLITYQLNGEDSLSHFDFWDESPDIEKIITRFSEFLHPEVSFEFQRSPDQAEESIAEIRNRMAHARTYLEQFCGVQHWTYQLVADTEMALPSADRKMPANLTFAPSQTTDDK